MSKLVMHKCEKIMPSEAISFRKSKYKVKNESNVLDSRLLGAPAVQVDEDFKTLQDQILQVEYNPNPEKKKDHLRNNEVDELQLTQWLHQEAAKLRPDNF